MSSVKPKVAVIGAGTGGLTAVKECIDAGLFVECFEKGADVGGQWVYTPDPEPDVHSSIYNGVILNSFRDTSAFSDFPYDPARYPPYFSHRLQRRYLNEYADHFRLRDHIRFETEVLECRRVEERDDISDGGGKWMVKIRTARGASENSETGRQVVVVAEEELNFHAIMVATGAFTKPKMPDVKGIDLFKGTLLHSHYYRTPGPFEGKRVAVVGFGDSAVDIACEVGPQARELHLVARRGGWVLPRYVFGKPLERWNGMTAPRICLTPNTESRKRAIALCTDRRSTKGRASQTWIPQSIANYLDTKMVQFVQGKLPPALQCDHKLLEQNTTIRSDFHEKVANGVITPHRAALVSLTEHDIHLSSGEVLEVDAVIVCTGYHVGDIPIIPQDAVASRGLSPPHLDLWKQMVSPYYDGLYIMGLLQLFGPHGPGAEAQARFAAAMVAGAIRRPSQEDMMEDIRRVREWKSKTFLNSETHLFTLYAVQYIDELMEPLGAVPTMRKLLAGLFSASPVKTMKLIRAVFFGVVSSSQWRLFGHGRKEKLAEATLLRVAADKGHFLVEEEEALRSEGASIC